MESNGLMIQAAAAEPVEEMCSRPVQQQPRYKKVLAYIYNTAFACLLFIMAVIVFSMVQSRLTGGPPHLAGHQMYIVLGGSMSPAFEAGSLAFIEPVEPQHLTAGDIITYSSPGGSSITTHRIMEVHNEEGRLSFTTRGDANLVNDSNPVLAENVIGRVRLAVPYGGYLMDFAQSRQGILSLIIIPGILIIIFELRYLFRCAAEWEAQKKAQKT